MPAVQPAPGDAFVMAGALLLQEGHYAPPSATLDALI